MLKLRQLRHALSLAKYGNFHRADSIFTQTQELEREIQLLRGLGTGSFSVAMGVYPARAKSTRTPVTRSLPWRWTS